MGRGAWQAKVQEGVKESDMTVTSLQLLESVSLKIRVLSLAVGPRGRLLTPGLMCQFSVTVSQVWKHPSVQAW